MTILGVFAGVLVMLVPVAIVALIVAAAVNKDKGNDSTRFSNGVRAVYTYIIVIATLFMIIAGTITAVSSLLDYFLPESELEVVGENCRDYYSSSYCSATTKEIKIQNEKNIGMTEFASSLALVIVAIPLFVTHSKEAKRLREAKVEEKVKEEEKSVEKSKKQTTVKAKTTQKVSAKKVKKEQ